MTTIELLGPHADRPTEFLGVWQLGGWRVKVFGVAYEGETVAPRLLDDAKSLAARALPQPAADGSRYGVGFVVVHDGRGGNWVLVDWWANDNELNQVLYQSSDEAPSDFEHVTSGLISCVHEMKVIVHEYEAWLTTFLANPDGPDVEAYLRQVAL